MQHLATGSVITATKLAARVMGSRRFVPPALPTGALGSQAQEALLADEWAVCCAALGVPSDSSARWWGTIVQRYNEPQRAYHTVNHLYELFCQLYRVVGVYNYMFEEDMLTALGHAEAQLTGGKGGSTSTTALFVPPSRGAHAVGDSDTTTAVGPRVGQYLSSPFFSPVAVALTIFFHDIIYDPKAASGVNEEASALLFEEFCRECETAGAANRAAVREAQLRARAAAAAHSELLAEEAEALRAEKTAAEAARRRLIEGGAASNSGGSGGATLSRAQQQALEEEAAERQRDVRDNALYRRMDRPEKLAARAETIYLELHHSTPMAGVGPAVVSVVPKAIEAQVMYLIRATKNHTATAATPQMEAVRHPAMVAVADSADLILWQRAQQQPNSSALAALAASSGLSVPQLRRSLFSQHQSHCVSFVPTAETDLGLFLDMDLSIVGVSDRSRYDSYGDQIRYEYQHYPSRDYRSGRTAILGRFLAHAAAESDQPLFKTPLYRFWCGANARANLAREIQSLAVPELRARTITIGDVPKVMAFCRSNFTNATPAAALAAAAASGAPPQPPSEPLSSAALSFFRMSEPEMEYLAAFNFDLCLMLRVEDEAEMMAFLAHERGASSSSSSSPSSMDIAARVQEVSRASPPIVACVFSSLSDDADVRGASQRTAQDFCGRHLIIHSIVVHAYYRRRGVGSKLVRELINKARTGATSPPVKVSVLCPEPSTIGSAAAAASPTCTGAGPEKDFPTGGAPPQPSPPTAPSLITFFEKSGFERVGTQTVPVGGVGASGARPGLTLVELSAPLQ